MRIRAGQHLHPGCLNARRDERPRFVAEAATRVTLGSFRILKDRMYEFSKIRNMNGIDLEFHVQLTQVPIAGNG